MHVHAYADNRVWFNREEAAEYLRLSPHTLAHDNTIPVHRYGRRVLYYRPDLDAWLLSTRNQPEEAEQ